MQQYLEATEYINWREPTIIAQAKTLAAGRDNPHDIAKACFEFVRDEIKHSWDFQLNPVTAKAEDVLKFGTGYCYAKSHLLAALLRANGIPAGLCYQRLTATDEPPYCLHGLNAVFLEGFGWYRIDPRGNKEGVETDFCPPVEKLAYTPLIEGEADLPEIWAEPLPVVIQALNENKSIIDVSENLPDIELIRTTSELSKSTR